MLRLPEVPWMDSGRTRRVVQLLVVLWVLAAADLFFTLWANRFTPFYEMNPLARGLLEGNATAKLVFFKFSLTALGSMIFWHLRSHGRAEAALWALVAVYIGLAFRWSDYTSVVMAMPPVT